MSLAAGWVSHAADAALQHALEQKSAHGAAAGGGQHQAGFRDEPLYVLEQAQFIGGASADLAVGTHGERAVQFEPCAQREHTVAQIGLG